MTTRGTDDRIDNNNKKSVDAKRMRSTTTGEQEAKNAIATSATVTTNQRRVRDAFMCLFVCCFSSYFHRVYGISVGDEVHSRIIYFMWSTRWERVKDTNVHWASILRHAQFSIRRSSRCFCSFSIVGQFSLFIRVQLSLFDSSEMMANKKCTRHYHFGGSIELKCDETRNVHEIKSGRGIETMNKQNKYTTQIQCKNGLGQRRQYHARMNHKWRSHFAVCEGAGNECRFGLNRSAYRSKRKIQIAWIIMRKYKNKKKSNSEGTKRNIVHARDRRKTTTNICISCILTNFKWAIRSKSICGRLNSIRVHVDISDKQKKLNCCSSTMIKDNYYWTNRDDSLVVVARHKRFTFCRKNLRTIDAWAHLMCAGVNEFPIIRN